MHPHRKHLQKKIPAQEENNVPKAAEIPPVVQLDHDKIVEEGGSQIQNNQQEQARQEENVPVAPEVPIAQIDPDKPVEDLSPRLQNDQQAQAQQATMLSRGEIVEIVNQQLKSHQQCSVPDASMIEEMVNRYIQSHPQAAVIDEGKIAKVMLEVWGKQNSQQGAQDKCSLKGQELRLEDSELFSNKNYGRTKDIKGTSKLIYTTYQQIENINNSYEIFFESANLYNEKAEITKKGNKLYGLLGEAKDSLFNVNSLNEEVANALLLQITKIKQIASKEFTDSNNRLYNKIKGNDEIAHLVQEYCKACSGAIEELKENDQLMFYSICSVNIMIGLENSNYEQS